MDEISLILWVGAILGLILQYRLKVTPVCLITELLALGGLVQAIAEYDATNLNEWTATVLIIAMVSVMIWSIWNYIQVFSRGKK